MSYADEVDQLARALARLATLHAPHLDDVGFQAALAGRTSLLGLLVTIHAEASGMGPSSRQMTVVDLARHPVAVLGSALREHPRPRADVSPTDLHQARPTTEAGRLWMDVGLRATLAQREWQGDGDRLSGETAWGAVADVVAMARTLVSLDEDLAHAAGALDRADIRKCLSRTNTSPLRLAAEEALALAHARPLPEEPVRRFAVPPLRVLPISSARQLHAGQAQLARLLRHAGPMKPQHVEQMTIAHARICLHVAALASDSANDTLAADLRHHAELLGDAVGSARRLATLDPADLRPRLQASELLRAHRDRDTRPAQVDLYAARLAVVTKALANVAHHEIRAGRWLGPAGGDSARLTWAPLSGLSVTPHLVQALDAAARNGASRLSRWQAATSPPARAAHLSPRRHLGRLSQPHHQARPPSPACAVRPLSHGVRP